jgi:hypothetical protein
MDQVAEREGLTRDDLEDRAVPTHRLERGPLRATVGDYTAEIALRPPSQVVLQWSGADGAVLPDEPSDLPASAAAEVAAVKATAEEVRKTLVAQRDRVERLLLGDRAWPLGEWRRLYLDHPLISVLARSLIWTCEADGQTTLGAWRDGSLVDVEDRPLPDLADDTRVRLWHPIGSPAETVLAWRRWLERHEVTQPFKQAHREIYLLTDAERAAGVESNRFAEHILRQHQLRALCQQRGWRYALQGSFDSGGDTTPTLLLPRWDLRAELYVEPIEEDDMLSPNAIFLYVTTYQVYFRRGGDAPANPANQLRREWMKRARAMLRGDDLRPVSLDELFAAQAAANEPVSLAEVPPVVFSEVMRDVDLFVGVCSVGADPTWLDRAPERYGAYWHAFSFGELLPSAHTRRAVLEDLLPRLSIAPRCTLADRFLTVRGDLRTYKIHLGSGNVLMEPNNQYLCIVPSRGASAPGDPGHIYLPFAEDPVLSLILSKAFLLANDRDIKDPSISRQINTG